MKVYVIVNALSGKVNQPFVCSSEAEAREFCLKLILSDQTNSVLNLSKFFFCHELCDISLDEANFINRQIGDPDLCEYISEKAFTPEVSANVLSAPSFRLYDIVSPYIDQVLANKKIEEVTNEKDNT